MAVGDCSVTKGVRELPGNVQSAAQFVPSRQAMTVFAIMVAAGVFFMFMAFFLFLPVIGLFPQKFAICFTIGCIFMMGSFFALKGPKTQFYHMISKEVHFSSMAMFYCVVFLCVCRWPRHFLTNWLARKIGVVLVSLLVRNIVRSNPCSNCEAEVPLSRC